MNNDTQYDVERYIPILHKAAAKYSFYFNNDRGEAFGEFSLKAYEFILKRQAVNAVVNDALIYSSCKNHAIDHYRKDSAFKRSLNRNALDIDEFSERLGIEQEIEDSEYLTQIKERAFAVATDEQRKLIEIRLSNVELTYTEIATKLDVHLSTVTRSAKSLRKRYEKIYGTIA